jgi:hypothetical protein
MSNELRFPDPAPDREIATALGPALDPPLDTPAYWDGLHRRIMARIAATNPVAPWWSISPLVARAGLIAAALALLALGALALQTREVESRMAFQAVMETELEVARVLPGIDEPFDRAPRAPSTDSQR